MKHGKSIIEVNGTKYTLTAYEESSGYKTCSQCLISKELSCFVHKPRNSKRNTLVSQYASLCKACNSILTLKLYYENRDSKVDYQKKLNRAKIEEYRHRKSAQASKERATKKNATPPWFSSDDTAEVKGIFKHREQLVKQTGIDHHVDHIIPLNGTTVCGLHVPWNLRVIPAVENLNKSATIDNGLLSQLYIGFEPTEITPELYYLLSQHDDKLKFKQT